MAMSYQQKRTLVTLVCGILLLFAYCFFILPQYQLGSNSNDLKFWATSILIFLGISIVINIIIQIIFHILLSVSIAVKETIKNEKVVDKTIDKKIKLEMVEDERDQMIELKSLRIGYILTGTAIVTSIIALVIGSTPAIMLNILFLGCMLSSIIEGVFQYYFYSKN
jgi:hypothetical protein